MFSKVCINNFWITFFFKVYFPIVRQTDLDKAIALLDQSPHLTSLRLTLTPKTLTEFVPEDVLDNNIYSHTNGYVSNIHPSLEERLSAGREKVSFIKIRIPFDKLF